MRSIPFTKMQGTGNDFILVDEAAVGADSDWPNLARQACDRHFGIGADGLILVMPSSVADFRMRMWNPDGSESQMCGNGIRCFARRVFERNPMNEWSLSVETSAGIKEVRLGVLHNAVTEVRVNMGMPAFEAARIPIGLDLPVVQDYPLTVGERVYEVSCVSMGNPHTICFLPEEDVDRLDLCTIGPLFEHHRLFSERTNAEFCAVRDERTVRMRVWERGAGETLACGTGACAAAVSAIRHGFVTPEVTIVLDGGRLTIEWQGGQEPVYMTGPAEYVCAGEYAWQE